MTSTLAQSTHVSHPISMKSYQSYCEKIKNNIYDPVTLDFISQLNGRVAYIFSKLKSITNSTIESFDYINAYDKDDENGHFDPIEFAQTISIMGNFSDKYSKPFGHSFPTSFLFNNFEEKSSIIYSNFLMEQTVIFDSSCKVPAIAMPKEYTYPQMIDELVCSFR